MTRVTKNSGRRNFDQLNTWTPAIAAEWAGIPLRTLYRLLQENQVPCIPMGESQTQRFQKAHDGKRRRRCFKWVLPRVAFIRWFENIEKPDSGKADTAA